MLARLRSVTPSAEPPIIEYELIDDRDGLPLTPPLTSVLDAQWWRSFQPLVRRQG